MHQIHGSVYEFLRNSRLDSNNFFLNRSDVFGCYEGVRERRQQTSQATIPLRLQPACAVHSGEFRPHPARTSLSRNSQP